jgi:hypothetical protein
MLMYFPDPGPLLDAIAQVVIPGGTVSLLAGNGDARAMRPGLLGGWAKADRTGAYPACRRAAAPCRGARLTGTS